jgi:ubiquinone/menaquinone biosynthesis C-methylase UbiE/DNA-binding transcriptional ArsR family regulator
MGDLQSITGILKTLSDQNRIRVLTLLENNELTVKEMLEILQISQSTLSSQLSQLKESGLVKSRREGQFVYYKLPRQFSDKFNRPLLGLILPYIKEAEWYDRDQRNLREVLKKRRAASWQYFADRNVQNSRSPGQTWESFAMGIMSLLPASRIADFGCGAGRIAALLSEFGHEVIGVDNNRKQIAAASELHADQAERLSFVLADMEDCGLEDQSVDIVLISQALHHSAEPSKVIAEAARVLRPAGQVLILDLHMHNQDWLQDRFGDYWLGFNQERLEEWLREAGLIPAGARILRSDSEHPDIDTLIIYGRKPG